MLDILYFILSQYVTNMYIKTVNIEFAAHLLE